MSTFSNALALAILFLSASGAAAHEIAHNGIKLVHPWVREAPKGAESVPAFVKITNTGKKADRLVTASLKGADKAEIHQTVTSGGTSAMQPMPDGVPIKAGETVQLEPDGTHIMFLGLKTSLDADQYVDGSLTFEKAGKIDVEFYVEARPEGAEGHGDH